MKTLLSLVAVTFAISLAACGGGSGTVPAAPNIGTPSGNIVITPANPTLTASGSYQFTASEAGYPGEFTSQPVGNGCVTMTSGPATSFGGSATGCSSFPTSRTYTISDAAGHNLAVTVTVTGP